ncbi:MAG TPA: ATP-binding cassette domain-containing protein [Rhodospirillales bacterium]
MRIFNRKDKTRPGPGHLSAAAFMPGGVFDMAVTSVFINVLALAVPLALMRIFDRIIPARDSNAVIWLAIGIASAVILETLLRIGRAYVGGWMGARFEHLAGCGAIERLLGAAITEYEKRGAGAYVERLNALGPLRELYGGRATGAVSDLPFVLVYLGAIAYLAGTLVIVPVGMIVAFTVAALAVGRLRRALETRMLANDRRFGFIIEVLSGVHTVKGLAMEEQMLRRYERLQESSAAADYRLALDKDSLSNLGGLLSQVTLIAVAGVGSLFVLGGGLSVGGLAASIMLAGRAIHPVESIIDLLPRFQAAGLARQRLRQIFEMAVDKPTGLLELPPIDGAVALDGVSFSYGKGKDGEDLPPIFRNVNLSVEPGQTVGVVGRSASGKTTLLYLMLGLLTPGAGVVRVDGYDLREYDPDDVRRQVAYLPQEARMFNGTVLQNITMFQDSLIPDARSIATVLGLDSVIQVLPKSYDTAIGQGAEDRLPRGTRQRIAIARALLNKPKVLLFDEANAFIDGPGDEQLMRVLQALRGRVTMILVTQRPSVLRICDRILEIRDAGLVEHKASGGGDGRAERPASGPGGAPKPKIPPPAAAPRL